LINLVTTTMIQDKHDLCQNVKEKEEYGRTTIIRGEMKESPRKRQFYAFFSIKMQRIGVYRSIK
jgi:hypothetical protein